MDLIYKKPVPHKQEQVNIEFNKRKEENPQTEIIENNEYKEDKDNSCMLIVDSVYF